MRLSYFALVDRVRAAKSLAPILIPTLVLILFASAGCATHERVDGILALRGDDARGAELFSEHCSQCHGDDAKGGQMGPNLLAHPHSAASTLTTILEGQGKMPSFNSKLSDQDAADVLCWLQNQQK